MNRLRRPSQFTPMHRRRFLKLALGLLAGSTAALLSVQIALADSASLSCRQDQEAADVPITATLTYTSATGKCRVGMAIDFTWDSNKIDLTPAPTGGPGGIPLNANCVATFAFTPAKAVPTDSSPLTYLISANAIQTRTSGVSRYTILAPPSPTPPIPTPPATPPPPTPPPTQPPTSAPTPVQRPTPTASASPRCYVEGTSPACPSPSTPTCAPPVAAMLPGTPGGGVPPLMLGLIVAPFGLMLVITPRLRSKRLTKVSALLLLVIAGSCTWPPPKSVATSPVTAAVGFEVTPDCRGYWIAASDGGIFPFGGATGYRSAVAIQLNKPIVDMESTPDGGGYWLGVRGAGVFPFGNATGYGRTRPLQLDQPIVGREETPHRRGDRVGSARGGGLWGGGGGGGVFPFGEGGGLRKPGRNKAKKADRRHGSHS